MRHELRLFTPTCSFLESLSILICAISSSVLHTYTKYNKYARHAKIGGSLTFFDPQIVRENVIQHFFPKLVTGTVAVILD